MTCGCVKKKANHLIPEPYSLRFILRNFSHGGFLTMLAMLARQARQCLKLYISRTIKIDYRLVNFLTFAIKSF